jgi:hypothetical protein
VPDGSRRPAPRHPVPVFPGSEARLSWSSRS